jgi:hypothetical protein
MKYALLNEHQKIIDVSDSQFPVHPSLSWVECDDVVTTSYAYSDGKFISPEPPPPEYIGNRAAEYPSVNDYLDGIVKGDQAQIDAYIAACQAVKAKYPKPE